MGWSPCSTSMIASRRAASATGPSAAAPAASGPRWRRAALIASSTARSGPAGSAMPAMPHTSVAELAGDEREGLGEHGQIQAGRAVRDVLEVVRELLLPGHLAREPELREPA